MLSTQARWSKGQMPWERNPNKILTKSQLGRTKPITFDLPQDKHSYGKQIPHDQYKARQVIYDWQQHSSSVPRPPSTKNMIEANKGCITNGLHTSGDFYKYRQTNSSILPRKTLGSKEIRIKLPEEGFTYGKQNKPNDAMRTVLGGGYEIYQSERVERIYNTRNAFKSAAPRKLSAHLTKSYYLMKDNAQKRLEALTWKRLPEKTFKLSKFNQVEHKVDDRRRPKTSNGISSQNYEEAGRQSERLESKEI